MKLLPSIVTAVGVPALQRLVVGAILNVPPLAEPQAPLVEDVPDELVLAPELELVLVPELEFVELDVVPELELVEEPPELVLTVPELPDPATVPLELDVLLPELVELDVLDPLDEAVTEPDELEVPPVLCV
jgi:hypothetical protein